MNHREQLDVSVKLQSAIDSLEKFKAEIEIMDKRLVQLDKKISRMLGILESDGAAK